MSLDSRIPLRLAFAIKDRHIQAVAARHGDITIGAIYIAPQLSKSQMDQALSRISHAVRGRVLMLGDLNARTKTWCTATNANGASLQRWVTRYHLRVVAPAYPTYSQSSTVDLILAKAVRIDTVTVRNGLWNSDHNLMLCRFVTEIPYSPRRIAQKLLSRPEAQEKARDFYNRNLPILKTSAEQCSTANELENVVSDLNTMFHKP